MNTLAFYIHPDLFAEIVSGAKKVLEVPNWYWNDYKLVETNEFDNAVVDDEDKIIPLKYNYLRIISGDEERVIDVISVEEVKVDDGYDMHYNLGDIHPGDYCEREDDPQKTDAPSILFDNWEDYLDGRRGKRTIPLFEEAAYSDVSSEKQAELIHIFNKSYFTNGGETDVIEILEDVKNDILSLTTFDIPTNIIEAEKFYKKILYSKLVLPQFNKKGERVYYKPSGWFKHMESINIFLSLVLYSIQPEFYFPNLFAIRFDALQRVADKYGILLPEVPKRMDHEARCLYYIELCKVLYQFRINNDLDPVEFCAFLFEYAQTANPAQEDELPEPAQAWFVGGKSDKDEDEAAVRFWQANPDTKRGDILVHYETSPVSAITAIWRSYSVGTVDPFFPYYSYTYMCKRIDIPHISQKELEENEHFKNHTLVRKNFQGVNGWTITGQDYRELLTILESKGFDTSVLPSLYAPELPVGIVITNEDDVSQKLLKPMLESMGWKFRVDFFDEVQFDAGRGTTTGKRPDFCLHMKTVQGSPEAKVIFECKEHMKNNKEIAKNFHQGHTYAKWGNAQVLVLPDKEKLLVYRRKNGAFDSSDYLTFYWTEVMGGNPDKFNELKKMLS